jgi:hypothetical protein
MRNGEEIVERGGKPPGDPADAGARIAAFTVITVRPR